MKDFDSFLIVDEIYVIFVFVYKFSIRFRDGKITETTIPPSFLSNMDAIYYIDGENRTAMEVLSKVNEAFGAIVKRKLNE